MIAKEIFSVLDKASSYIDYYKTKNSILDDMRDFIKEEFHIVRKGDYAIVYGARKSSALRRGILGTRYAVANADNYWNIFENIHVPTALKSEFFLSHNKHLNHGAIFNYVGIAIGTTLGAFENLQNGTRDKK